MHVTVHHAEPTVKTALVQGILHFDAVPIVGHDQLDWVATIDQYVFDDLIAFPTGDLFERFEACADVEETSRGLTAFHRADGLATAYRKMFPNLDDSQKLRAVRRVTKAALALHRFWAMDELRTIFEQESDEGLKVQMARIVDEEDPSHVIHRRHAIPVLKIPDSEGESPGVSEGFIL